ncbi:MAG TPA: type II secretion system protein [Pontiella sp.]
MQLIKKYGFTLVEILVAVAIMGLLTIIVIPSLSKARSSARAKICVKNLLQMEAAKEMAAMYYGWPNNAGYGRVPSWRDKCDSFMKGEKRPVCPSGYEYFYNSLETASTCQSGFEGHVIYSDPE